MTASESSPSLSTTLTKCGLAGWPDWADVTANTSKIAPSAPSVTVKVGRSRVFTRASSLFTIWDAIVRRCGVKRWGMPSGHVGTREHAVWHQELGGRSRGLGDHLLQFRQIGCVD